MAAPSVPYPTTGKIMGRTLQGWQRDLWSPASFDYDTWEDSFVGDAKLDEYPAIAESGGGSAVTFSEHTTNGYLSLVTGAVNDNYAGQGVGMNWTGDRGCLFEAIFNFGSSVAAYKMEIGLTDNDQDPGAVLQKQDTTTSTADDYAVFVVDTDDDANIAFYSRKDAGTVVETNDIVAAVADTTYRFAVRVEGDTVKAWLNGNEVGNVDGHAIQGGDGITPWVFVRARSGSSRTSTLYKWRVTQPAW